MKIIKDLKYCVFFNFRDDDVAFAVMDRALVRNGCKYFCLRKRLSFEINRVTTLYQLKFRIRLKL